MQYFVIGEREIVLAFALTGVTGASAVTRNECLDAFQRITGKGSIGIVSASGDIPRVLILTETAAILLEEEIRDWQMKGSYPLIVEIPGIMGRLEGIKNLTDSIREAIGIHI